MKNNSCYPDCHCQSGGNNNQFFNGLFTGALVGAGLLYFLTSTKEGQEIKEELKEKAKEGLDDLIKEIKNQGTDFRQKAVEIEQMISQKIDNSLAPAKEETAKPRRLMRFFTRLGKPLS